jgi:sec-independent protein translocase protein TatB
MIEISLGKLVLLALIALIVLGPEKLPHAARTAGALVRRLRQGWDSVRAEVERELEIEELKRTAREAAARAEAMQAEMNKAARETREHVTSTASEVRDSVADVQKELAQADAAIKESPHGGA